MAGPISAASAAAAPRKTPWGAVLLSQASMGDDDQWHGSLYDAAVSFGLCDSVEPA